MENTPEISEKNFYNPTQRWTLHTWATRQLVQGSVPTSFDNAPDIESDLKIVTNSLKNIRVHPLHDVTSSKLTSFSLALKTGPK